MVAFGLAVVALLAWMAMRRARREVREERVVRQAACLTLQEQARGAQQTGDGELNILFGLGDMIRGAEKEKKLI